LVVGKNERKMEVPQLGEETFVEEGMEPGGGWKDVSCGYAWDAEEL
jgi:hypothetical protein